MGSGRRPITVPSFSGVCSMVHFYTLDLLMSLIGSLFNCRYAFAPLLCVGKVGLPGTVEAHESVGGVPESVWKKVQAVKLGGGGLAELEEKVMRNSSSTADIL